jgi:vesicle coat complex subunit
MRHLLPLALLAGLILGCSRDNGPLLSHGQPVSHWVAALQDRDPVKRKHAVTALGHAGAADPDAIPPVIGALKDRDARVRAEAALALLNLGPAARDAVPALGEATKDRDATVRSYAHKALERIQAE